MQNKWIIKNIGLVSLLIIILLINGCINTGQIVRENNDKEFLILDVKIPSEDLFVNAGDDINANIEIIRVDGKIERKDYHIQAYIIDEDDHIITEQSKTIAIGES